MILYDSDSDDELEIVTIASMEAESSSKSRHAAHKRREFVWRNPLQGHQRHFLDYFADPPVYPPKLFRRRFRMNCSLFLRIQSEVEAYEPYFVQKRNGAGVLAIDFMDEYLRIGESTAMKSVKKFVKAVVAIFSDEYLRSPNNDDIASLLAVGESHGFPRMLGSIDCMHWTWKNCPTAWKERSSVFTELAQGRAPRVNYTINGNEYTMGYYLANGKKNKHFAEAQEAYRKDVERAFGVLQAHFAIMRGPARPWDLQTLKDIIKACIILHNMIIEDERDDEGEQNIDYEQIDKIPLSQVSLERTPDIMEFIQQHRRIRDRETHSRL
ncbi:uncharacterized protein LOC114314866 [Camellia sinensis]|uniref:uncharacterized protein LOC114314866 n=1 Tax=Camellia sinensis TaxID=4442 RepID=UPI0010364408|nr:uncharacterized protein LOC114314866 [Camellia sinensis]